MADHTPGPWHKMGALHGVRADNVNDLRIVQQFETRPPSTTLQANAHLIAAAPDLLAALEAIVNSEWRTAGDPITEGDVVVTRDMIETARAAITKAKGENNEDR